MKSIAVALHALRPLRDEEIPHLTTRMTRGIAIISGISAVVCPLFGCVAWAMGIVEPAGALASTGVYVGGFGLCYWFASSSRHVSPQFPIFMAMLIIMMGVIFAGLFASDMGALAVYAIAVPLVASGFFPWQPRWSFALGSAAVVLPLVFVPEKISVPIPLYVCLGVTYTSLAAAANQVQRRVWRELERTRQTLAAFERMSSLGRMVAGIAHELKTPVASTANSLAHINGLAIELMASIGHASVTDADLREIAQEVSGSAELAARAVERCGRFLRAIRAQTLGMNETEIVDIDLGACLCNAIALLDYRAKRAGIVLEMFPDRVLVRGDRSKLEQVVTNLIANGIEACAEANRGSFVRAAIRRDARGVLLSIQDDGPGVPVEYREQIFDPLFTTRSASGGTGVGLSISRDIVEAAFGGTLRLVNVDRGARFEIWLPKEGGHAGLSRAFMPPPLDPRG